MKIKTLLIVSLLFLSINIFATGVSFEENREDAVNDLKTFTVETSVLKLEEDSSTSIPTIKQYWLNSENNSINELIDFAININDIGTGSNSIYYKWAKDSNNNIVLQNGTSSDYNLKINYSNYTNTSQSITTNNTTISDKFFYNSPTGTILNSATGTTISGIFANNHNSQYDQFYNGGNIINYRYKISSIDGIFVNNYENGSTRAFGGAIFNTENYVGVIRTYIDDISGDFIGNYTISSGNNSNVLSCGGAIYNYTTVGNINSDFILNHSNGVHCDGGALANCDINTNHMAYITNIKGDFLLNYIYATGSSSGGNGGAIYNNGYITNIEGNFIGNSIKSILYTGDGGAIFNEHDIQNITGNFIENHIDSYLTASGGAIFTKPSLTGEYCINNIEGNFIGNYANSTNGSAYGGAIYNKHIINNISGLFIGNYVTGVLGAYGGAIYNEGRINLIADEHNIEFTGNTANGVSNAIHDNNGTINLWVNENKSIVFNDRITSENSSSILNINNSTTTLNAVGKIILNEDMSGYLGTVNLYCGEIELQAKTNGINNINTNKFFSGNINLSSGTLNILNNAIDNITVSTLTTTVNANLKIDVDLNKNISDNFTVTNTITGELNLTAINILGINKEDKGQIVLFNNGNTPVLNILTPVSFCDRYEYIFENSEIEGVLKYKKTENIKTFKEIINSEIFSSRSCSLFEDEIITENLGNLGGHQLTIFGNGYDVKSSNNFEGIYIASDKILNIENINNWSGFNNTYGAIKNEGTLNISGTNFSNNEEHDIINNGNLIFADVSSNFEKGIIGTGTTTISGVSINLANAVIEQNKIEIENNGSLNFYGGTNNNVITGTGLIQIFDNVTNKANITQHNLEILTNKQLNNSTSTITINQTLIINNNSKIINDGKFIINNGTNTGTIEQTINTSTISIFGNFINNGTIEQSIFNIGENGKIQNNNVVAITKITNNGNIETSATNINGQIENNGSLNFYGGTNNNVITGTGLIQIFDNVTNKANITQHNLEILGNKQLTNTSTITITDLLTISNNAKIINSGKLLINNGINTGNIEQTTNTSAVIIQGNFTNNGIITSATTIRGKFINNGIINYILDIETNGEFINNNQIVANIKNNGNLRSDATNINGNIENNGNLIFNSGTENNNEITGNGKLYINCNLTNNNSINQKEIEINSNINMVNSLSNSEQKLNEFINNSEISAEKLKLKATMLKLTENGILKVNNFYSEQNSAMDLANNKIQQHNFKTISVTDTLNLSIDVDLINKQMDTITTDNYNGTGKININEINILTDIKQEKVSITFTTSTALKENITSVNTANSKVFKYDVEYNKNLGNLIFSLTKDINFTVIESQVANSVGGFVTQTTIFNQAFASMENIKSRILQVKNKITDESPLYASTANTIFFQKTNRIESGLWLRPFYSQETVTLDNLSVDNTLTGTLAGLDLATGENSLVSLYLGYAGSEQKYENIKVSQTGYILGVTGMLVKEQWYAGLTANINFNKAESQSSYGTDNFDMNMYSVGAKAGYNFDLSDKWKLEPNLMLMYGNVNSQEYKTKQGAKVEGQSVANIVFEPQIKAKLNLENGWQPYGLIGYVVNAGDKITTKVEEVEFDGQKIGNYVEFGAGVDKSFKNSPWSLYIQLTGRRGDRTGFDGNFGIKYSFLTAKEKNKIKKIKKIEKRRAEKKRALEEERKEQKRIEREKKKAELKEQQEIEEENKRIQQEKQEEQRRLEIQRRIKANYEE